MRGTFRSGDCLHVESVDIPHVRLGDVVIYQGIDHRGREEEMVHRVVKVTPRGLIARGDNNSRVDATLVTEDNLQGRVRRVERGGRAFPVACGWVGLLRAKVLHVRRQAWTGVWWAFTVLGRRPYRWLRHSDVVARLWHPSILEMHLETESGLLVKYVCNGRTVACWHVAENRFMCHKPYDLVLRHTDRGRVGTK